MISLLIIFFIQINFYNILKMVLFFIIFLIIIIEASGEPLQTLVTEITTLPNFPNGVELTRLLVIVLIANKKQELNSDDDANYA